MQNLHRVRESVHIFCGQNSFKTHKTRTVPFYPTSISRIMCTRQQFRLYAIYMESENLLNLHTMRENVHSFHTTVSRDSCSKKERLTCATHLFSGVET